MEEIKENPCIEVFETYNKELEKYYVMITTAYYIKLLQN